MQGKQDLQLDVQLTTCYGSANPSCNEENKHVEVTVQLLQ